MSLKKSGVALLAAIVLYAITAGSAYAENEFSETGGQWYTGASPGTKLPEASTLDFPTWSGGAVRLKNGSLDVTGTSFVGKECSLKNVGTKATMDCKSVTIDGMTVSEPANCEVAQNAEGKQSVTTKPVTAILGMNKAGTKGTLKLTPQEGTTLATIEIVGEKCAVAGLYKLTGTIFAQAVNATGVFGLSQEFEFNEEIQKSAGTATSLKLGESAAILTGSVKATAATEWAGKEK